VQNTQIVLQPLTSRPHTRQRVLLDEVRRHHAMDGSDVARGNAVIDGRVELPDNIGSV
jgi:hypothetical protein